MLSDGVVVFCCSLVIIVDIVYTLTGRMAHCTDSAMQGLHRRHYGAEEVWKPAVAEFAAVAGI